MQTLLKLIALSFVVGLVIAVAGIDPVNLWRDLAGTIGEIWALFGDTARWAIKYIVMGAIVVFPIWILITVIQKAADARSSR